MSTTCQTLSVDTHCAMLTDHIRDKSAKVMEGFKHFVQIYSAILGGSVAVRLQYGVEETQQFANAANGLVALVAIVSGLVMLENWRSWIGFRNRLSDIAGTDETGTLIVGRPRARAGLVHSTLIATAGLATILFWIFNPLR